MEINKIYNEDCILTMADMPEEFIDLVVTSPPYDNLREYNGYSFRFEDVAQMLYKRLKIGGVIVWVVGDATIEGSETGTSFRQALYFKEMGLNLHDTMIYEKPHTGVGGSNYCYMQSFEYMFVFSKGRPNTINLIKDYVSRDAGKVRTVRKTRSDKSGYLKETKKITIPLNTYRKNIWLIRPDHESVNHPAKFPDLLVADHIKTWSNEGDLVYDPFMGSGTTAKMAHLYKRNWIGSEISKEYVDLANKRLKPYLDQKTLF